MALFECCCLQAHQEPYAQNLKPQHMYKATVALLEVGLDSSDVDWCTLGREATAYRQARGTTRSSLANTQRVKTSWDTETMTETKSFHSVRVVFLACPT